MYRVPRLETCNLYYFVPEEKSLPYKEAPWLFHKLLRPFSTFLIFLWRTEPLANQRIPSVSLIAVLGDVDEGYEDILS